MNPLSNKLTALTEYQRRQDCRNSFLAWCRAAGYEPAAHHRIIIAKLEQAVEHLFKALVRGHAVPEEKLRYMFMTPPGTAKSTYISKLFPPWLLAQIPRLRKMLEAAGKAYVDFGVLATTHNGDLALEFGAAARNTVTAHEQLLGYSLRPDSRAEGAWTCTNGGYYRAATVGSGISGRRMHVGFVDDYIGKEEDATSKLVNDKIWIWWENDFVNRLQPISLRFIIANHRNEDDLIGRLLAKEREQWEVTKFRLIIENEEQAAEDPLGRKVGEYIWPEYFTREQVEERMRNPRASGIQQQDPAPEKGGFFEADWIQTYTQLPDEGTIYGASDHAVSEKQTADLTCCVLGKFIDGRLYILPDIAWDRLNAAKAVNEMIRLMKSHSPVCWWAEKGHISKSIGPFLQDRMMDERFFSNIVEVTPVKDKQTRAQSLQGMMKTGMILFPQNAPWYARARRELLLFPNGKHDDLVDALAHLARGVHMMVGSRKPKKDVPTAQEIVSKPFTPTLRWVKDSVKAKDRLRIAALRDE